MLTDGHKDADRLMHEWVIEWQKDPTLYGSFEDFIELAIEGTARGLSYADVAEESVERAHARHHEDQRDQPWGTVDEDRSERAWSYADLTPDEVLDRLGAVRP